MWEKKIQEITSSSCETFNKALNFPDLQFEGD